MFGSLKKRLKDAVKKVSGNVSKEEVELKDVAEEPKPAEEEVKEEIEEKIDKLEEIEEKIEEEKLPPEIVKSEIEEKKAFEEVKEEVRQEEQLVKEPEEIVKEIEPKQEEVKPEIKVEREEEKPAEPEKMVQEIEEIIEEKKPEPTIPTVEEKPEEKKEKKKRFGIFKKVVEKKLSESDIEKILKELQIALLENDTALEVADKICDDVKKDLIETSVKRGKVENVIKESLHKAMIDVMTQERPDIKSIIEGHDGPYTILLLGFNGTGKTTTLAKLASMYKDYKPVVAAADTFRAASIEQLEVHSKRLGFDVVKHKYGADSAAVVFDAKKHAAAQKSKLVLADTAGRSHANVNLMDELKKVVRVNSPDMKILVLDALTGNDIYDQAKLFNDAVGVDAIILTKTDVYEKGGAALSAAYTLKKPILFMGTGQGYENIKEFDPRAIADMLME